MAQFIGAVGKGGPFFLNTMLAMINIPIFYVLLRLFCSGRALGMGLLLFTFNFPQLYLARMTLTEMATQTMLLAAAVSLSLGLGRRIFRLTVLGHVFLVGAFLVRVDVLLLALPAIVAAGVYRVLSPLRVSAVLFSEKYIHSCRYLLLFLLPATFYHYWTSPMYFRHLSALVFLCWLVLAMLGFLVFRSSKLPPSESVFRLVRWKHLWTTLAAVSITAFLFALFLRPVDWPTYQTLVKHWSLDPNGLQNLAKYLSYPVVFLALVGWLSVLKGVLSGEEWFALPFVCLWFCAALVYLYDPMIWPNQPWASRRFQPLIIPGTCLLACRAWCSASGKISRALRSGINLVMCCFVLANCFFLAQSSLTVRSQDGTMRLLSQIRKNLEFDKPLILNDLTPFIMPLLLADGRACLPLNFDNPEDLRLGSRFFETSDSMQLISPVPIDFLQEQARIIESDILQPDPCVDPLEIGFHTQRTRLYLYDLNSPLHPLARKEVRLGGFAVPGVAEHGFYPREEEEGRPFRWTSGRALLKFSLMSRKIEEISVNLERPVVPYQVEIILNGETLLSETITENTISRKLEFPDRLIEDRKHSLELRCSTFRAPGDPRELGVRPRFVILTADDSRK